MNKTMLILAVLLVILIGNEILSLIALTAGAVWLVLQVAGLSVIAEQGSYRREHADNVRY